MKSAITDHLAETKNHKTAPREAFAEQLVFEPQTGELVVKNAHEVSQDPDAVIADQIALDGFFGEAVR